MAALTKSLLSEAEFKHGLEIIREYATNYLSGNGKTIKKYYIADRLGISHATLLKYFRLTEFTDIPNHVQFYKIVHFLLDAEKIEEEYNNYLGFKYKKANNMLQTIRNYSVKHSNDKNFIKSLMVMSGILSKETIVDYLTCANPIHVKNMKTLEKIYSAVCKLMAQ